MSFPNNCDARYVAVDASTGCSLTKASIVGMTPQTFEDQGAREVYMDRVITGAKEARIAGYTESFWESLFMSRLAGIKSELPKASIKNESIILPYIYRRQRRHINANYWKIHTGAAAAGAGSNGLHSGAWKLTVKNTSSPYATSMASIQRYFLPGKMLRVTHYDSSTKVSYSAVFKVISSTNADSGGTAYADIIVEPNYTNSAWGSLTTAQKAPWKPTYGQVVNLSNSVSNYESWCQNEASDINNKLLTFWLQTTRFTHSYNDQYLLALNAALTSGYWKEFRTLPLAQQKVQQRAKFMKDWITTCFFGQRISEKQAVETYTSLETVTDPANPDCVLEYKANALGFETQADNCGRVTDLSGTGLPLEDVWATSYLLKRARQSTGGTIDRIDWLTDRTSFGNTRDAMIAWYKAKYGVNIERHYAPNQKLTFQGQVELTYDIFEIPAEYGGFEFAVGHDDFFSDRIAAATGDTDQQNVERGFWAYDFSDLQVGVLDTQKVTRQTNLADNLYNCVIKPTVNQYELESMTFAPIMEDPLRHAIFKNFNGEVIGAPT